MLAHANGIDGYSIQWHKTGKIGPIYNKVLIHRYSWILYSSTNNAVIVVIMIIIMS